MRVSSAPALDRIIRDLIVPALLERLLAERREPAAESAEQVVHVESRPES